MVQFLNAPLQVQAAWQAHPPINRCLRPLDQTLQQSPWGVGAARRAATPTLRTSNCNAWFPRR
jgi:hypothetical protein